MASDGILSYLPEGYFLYLGPTFGCGIATTLHLLLLSDTVNDFRHKNDVVPPREMPLSCRVYWALCLRNATRRIEWNFMVCIAYIVLIDRFDTISATTTYPSRHG